MGYFYALGTNTQGNRALVGPANTQEEIEQQVENWIEKRIYEVSTPDRNRAFQEITAQMNRQRTQESGNVTVRDVNEEEEYDEGDDDDDDDDGEDPYD